MRPAPINRATLALIAVAVAVFLLSAFVPWWPTWELTR